MDNWHLVAAGILIGVGLMCFGAIVAHLYIYGF